MKIIPTEIPDVKLVKPDVFRDERGYFLEIHHLDKFSEAGITARFVQDNQAGSIRGVLRGLHAQRTHPQGKLIRALEGEIFDVAVDIRKSSRTFGKWVGRRLSADRFDQLYVPPGFAHGYCVLSEYAQIEYKCTDIYDPSDEITVLWNDPKIGVMWPTSKPILSDKDKNALPLHEQMDRMFD